MKSSLRSRFLLLLACIALLGGVAGYRFYAWYSGEIVAILGQRFAERNVLYEKSRVLGMVTREVTLVQKMADSQRLRDWAKSRKSPLRVQLVMGRLFWQSSDVKAMAEGRL